MKINGEWIQTVVESVSKDVYEFKDDLKLWDPLSKISESKSNDSKEISISNFFQLHSQNGNHSLLPWWKLKIGVKRKRDLLTCFLCSDFALSHQHVTVEFTCGAKAHSSCIQEWKKECLAQKQSDLCLNCYSPECRIVSKKYN